MEIDYLTKQVAKKEEKIKTQKEEINLLKNSLSSSYTKISQLNKDIDKLEEQLAVKNGSNPEDYSAFKVDCEIGTLFLYEENMFAKSDKHYYYMKKTCLLVSYHVFFLWYIIYSDIQ